MYLKAWDHWQQEICSKLAQVYSLAWLHSVKWQTLVFIRLRHTLQHMRVWRVCLTCPCPGCGTVTSEHSVRTDGPPNWATLTALISLLLPDMSDSAAPGHTLCQRQTEPQGSTLMTSLLFRALMAVGKQFIGTLPPPTGLEFGSDGLVCVLKKKKRNTFSQFCGLLWGTAGSDNTHFLSYVVECLWG